MGTELPPFASRVYFISKNDEAIFALADRLNGLVAKWRRLGLQLGIPLARLDEIQAVVSEDSSAAKLEKMLRYWLENATEGRRTWAFLADAVKRAGNNALACEIKDRLDYDPDAKVCLSLREMVEMLSHLRASWRKLACYLHVPLYKQDEINNSNGVSECLVKMLEAWIRGTGEATLERLIRALESPTVSYRALAHDLMKDAEIFRLLETEKGMRSIQKQLDDYISTLK